MTTYLKAPQITITGEDYESFVPAFDYPQGASAPWITVTDSQLASASGGILIDASLLKKKTKIQIKREVITKEVIKEVIKQVPDPQLLILLQEEKQLTEKLLQENKSLEDAILLILAGDM